MVVIEDFVKVVMVVYEYTEAMASVSAVVMIIEDLVKEFMVVYEYRGDDCDISGCGGYRRVKDGSGCCLDLKKVDVVLVVMVVEEAPEIVKVVVDG